MKRADLDKRAQRDKFGSGKHGFQSGNPSGGVLPTIPGAEWFDHVQEEIAGVIEAGGITVNPQQYNQLLTAMRKLFSDATRTLTAGAGLTGGGDLSANRTIGLATPSTLSGSTTNWVGNGATGHTHEIAKATPTLAGVAKLVNVLNSTATDAALTAAQGKVLADQIAAANANSVMLTGDQTIAGTKTFSGSLNTNAEIRAGGMVSASYRNDWVGFWANQPTEGKHGFFDVAVNGVTRGGMQIATHGNGRYHVDLLVTPAGATNADRRVSGMTVYDGSIYTHAYGWLHEGFIRNGVGAGQIAGHQISLGWSSGLRLKAQVDNVDLGNIVFDSQLNAGLSGKANLSDFAAYHGQSGYQRLPNGLIIQWMRITKAVGTFSGTYNFPIAFPRACFGVSISNSWYISGAGNGYQLRAGVLNNSSFGVGEDNFNNYGSGNSGQAFVIAIGN
ncbi:hypothetical protein V6667_06450 [Neisseria leonii]|uniref:Phage tail protein n=1 Tax=Neisseria leonii TaxID=2995413 RepID=A0A9X4E8W8_9NEIS|nr:MULTISPECIES: hypothetical protein [unclassified Neisseria]MDD9324739.1 hypothetical protein [Neisseria sp. 3986]MDD9327698.1 hypothetical protein [Neisseria sp. 51.81]